MRDKKRSSAAKNSQHFALPKAAGPLVIGKRACSEVIRSFPERIHRAYIVNGRQEDFQSLLRSVRLVPQVVEREQLDELTGSTSHQGWVLELLPRQQIDLKEFIKLQKDCEDSLVLALDDIQDPHNLGAIMRVAECFGVSAIIGSRNRGCGLTPTVTKTSAGASELVNYIEVANLRDAISKLKAEGFWVVATAKTEGAVELSKFDWPRKTILLLGGEGEGISNLLLKESDFQVWIPLKGRIDSLNVAQAAAILACEACKA